MLKTLSQMIALGQCKLGVRRVTAVTAILVTSSIRHLGHGFLFTSNRFVSSLCQPVCWNLCMQQHCSFYQLHKLRLPTSSDVRPIPVPCTFEATSRITFALAFWVQAVKVISISWYSCKVLLVTLWARHMSWYCLSDSEYHIQCWFSRANVCTLQIHQH